LLRRDKRRIHGSLRHLVLQSILVRSDSHP
jgi:hypothetical protein